MSSELPVNAVIDSKYRILGQLGAGGMGAVYKAEHVMMGRVVALKLLHPHLVEREELLKRFQYEARVASKLRHPNAITTFDYGLFNGAPYIVMEFVEGRTLKELISSSGPVPVDKAKKIISEICAALEQAHMLGIVHRDLKPDNIMLVRQPNESEQAVVLDFGIAKVLSETNAAEQAQQTAMTQEGTFVGTPRYSSPEQALSKPLDKRSDIYSLGVILYEALSGEVPFDAPSVMELLMKHLHVPPPSLREAKPQLKIPHELDCLVSKCLSKNPDERFQSMRELLAAIKALDEIPPASLVSAPLGLSLRPILGGATCALVLGASALWFYQKKKVQLLPAELQNEAGMQSEAVLQSTAGPEVVAAQASTEQEIPQAVQDKTPQFAFAAQVFAAAQQAMQMGKTLENKNVASTEASSLAAESAEGTAQLARQTPETVAADSPGGDTLVANTSPVRSREINAPGAKREAVRLFDAGMNLYRAKKYELAAEKFQEAIALRSDAVGSMIALGNCYLRLGKSGQALEAFNQAIALDPKYGPAHFSLAAFYAVNGRSRDALEELRTTIALDPRAKRAAQRDPDFAALRGSEEFKQLLR